jgi:polysaccharide export outer membrane protein
MQNCVSLQKSLLYLSLLMVLISSCNNRSIMYRTKRNYPYTDLSKVPPTREYKIGLNDQLDLIINPNKGATLIDGTNMTNAIGGASSNASSNAMNLNMPNFSVTVEFDGTIKLPVLGRVAVKDLTVREAELLLEERLKLFYVDPFVNIKLSNKRVIIFPGSAGTAHVLQLTNQNTTLTEAIALAGGIPNSGKANRIKLIRGEKANPEVYLIDLSTIDGMKKGDIVLQGNDIIYVEPVNDYITNFTTRIQSYFFIITTIFILRSFIN